MRVQQQSSFVLHKRPYSESSLLVDIFTREYGRLTLLAKGVRRMKSKYRGVLTSFSPLILGWSGKGELPVLTGAEHQGRISVLQGQARLCGFYANELIMRLLHKNDPHTRLYEDYENLVDALQMDLETQATLRVFEKRLLKELGYALDLETEANSRVAIDPHALYQFIPTHGAVRQNRSHQVENRSNIIQGKTLLALSREELDSQECLIESKWLMRSIMSYYLGARPLHSRKLFRPFR